MTPTADVERVAAADVRRMAGLCGLAPGIADTLLALLAEREASQWRPIESAPVGVLMLVFARKAHEGGPTTHTAEKTVTGEVLRQPMCARLSATHWRPLPEPPK